MNNLVEQKKYDELVEWENNYIASKGNFLTTGYKKFKSVVGPSIEEFLEPAVSKVKDIGQHDNILRIQVAIEMAIEGVFTMSHEAVKGSYKKELIYRKLDLDEHDDIYNVDSENIRVVLRKTGFQDRLIALLEGGAFGFGGVGTTLAEIPIFFMVMVRAQQQICAAYGYDPEDEFEQAYMLKAISFSSMAGNAGKASVKLELNALRVAIKRHTYARLNEMGGIYVIPAIAKAFAKKQGVNLGKKKMIQTIPVIGAAFGGLFNVGFLNGVIQVTNNLYQKRFIEDRREFLD